MWKLKFAFRVSINVRVTGKKKVCEQNCHLEHLWNYYIIKKALKSSNIGIFIFELFPLEFLNQVRPIRLRDGILYNPLTQFSRSSQNTAWYSPRVPFPVSCSFSENGQIPPPTMVPRRRMEALRRAPSPSSVNKTRIKLSNFYILLCTSYMCAIKI